MSLLQRFCDATSSLINIDKCVGLWHGNCEAFPAVYERIKCSSKPYTYLGVPLDQYKNKGDLWAEKTKGLSVLTQKWGGRDLSIFAHTTICNVFQVLRLVYLVQKLSCSRINIQRIHRLFAVFVWQS